MSHGLLLDGGSGGVAPAVRAGGQASRHHPVPAQRHVSAAACGVDVVGHTVTAPVGQSTGHSSRVGD